MSGDRVVAIIGLLMALALVLANGRLRAMPVGKSVRYAAIWVAIIVVAALLFSGFRR